MNLPSTLTQDFHIEFDIFGTMDDGTKVKPDCLLFPRGNMFEKIGFPKAVIPVKSLNDNTHKSYMAAWKLSYKYLRSSYVVSGKIYKPKLSLICDMDDSRKVQPMDRASASIEMTIAYLDIFMLTPKGKNGYEIRAGAANYFRRQSDYQGMTGDKSMAFNHESLLGRLPR